MSGKLKEVRERITSVNSTRQITNAMKMVSAAKLRKAQQAITEMRPYANKLYEILSNILKNLEGDAASAFGVARPVKSAAIVVVTSNRGLCGAFNSNVVKEAIHLMENQLAEVIKAEKVTLYFVGKKGYDSMKKRYPNMKMVTNHMGLFSDLSFDNVSPLSQELMDGFISGEYDAVYACYGSFKNAAVQIPMAVKFLPVDNIEVEEDKASETNFNADYIFEPSKEEILQKLIPNILQTSFHKYLLDTAASEHGARMTAMDKATENAGEMLKDLKITYNKARQEAITKEILEIVGGAAALEG